MPAARAGTGAVPSAVPDLLSWAGSARHRVFGCLDERFLRSCPGAPAISLSTSTRQPRCPLSLDCAGLLTSPSVRAGTSARSYRKARDRYASCEPLASDSRCVTGISMADFGMAATSGKASARRDRSDDPAELLDRPSELPCGRTVRPVGRVRPLIRRRAASACCDLSPGKPLTSENGQKAEAAVVELARATAHQFPSTG